MGKKHSIKIADVKGGESKGKVSEKMDENAEIISDSDSFEEKKEVYEEKADNAVGNHNSDKQDAGGKCRTAEVNNTKMKPALKKFLTSVLPVLLLTIVVILQLVRIAGIIVNDKKGYHSDEMFAYGMANNFYAPYLDAEGIHSYEDENSGRKNVNEWVSGDLLRDYITVQQGEQFRYDSVWYNLKMDRHTPMHEVILHTISSFFPDTFTPWFGYAINFVCFIVIQMFLYKLIKNLLRSEYLALIVCTCWGFSAGAVNMTIYIRMYCMLAMWTLILFYLHSKLYSSDDKPLPGQLIPIIAVTVCGCLTQHIFLFAAFVLAVVFCIRYLITKRFKAFLAYGFSMLGGVLLSFAIFPYSISHLLYESGNESGADVMKQFRIAIRYCLNEVFPADLITITMILKIAAVVLAVVLMLAIPVLFLFRDKPVISSFVGKLRDGTKSVPGKIKVTGVKKIWAFLVRNLRKCSPVSFCIVISTILITFVTAKTVEFISMGNVDRYLFIMFPLVLVAATSIIYFLAAMFPVHIRRIVTAALVLVTVIPCFTVADDYLFRERGTVKNVRELTAGSDCIVVTGSKQTTWLMNTLANEIYDIDKIFYTYLDDGEMTVDKQLLNIETDKPIYLMYETYAPIKSNTDEEEISNTNDEDDIPLEESEDIKRFQDYFRTLPVSKMFEYQGTSIVFEREYQIYRLA